MLKHGFKAMLAEANAVIETVSVQDLLYYLEDAINDPELSGGSE